MKKIIVCGDFGEKLLTKTIVNACNNYGGALVCEEGKIAETASEAEFLVLSVNKLTQVSCKGVVVFGDAPFSMSSGLRLEGVTAIADTGSADAMNILSRTGAPVIGCSCSGRDTLTLSCRNGDHTIICLQRSLRTLSGKIIEPCETDAFCPEDIPLYPVLAACCVLMLNDIPTDAGYRLMS